MTTALALVVLIGAGAVVARLVRAVDTSLGGPEGGAAPADRAPEGEAAPAVRAMPAAAGTQVGPGPGAGPVERSRSPGAAPRAVPSMQAGLSRGSLKTL